MRTAIAIFLISIVSVPCAAQDTTLPATLSGFLKPGSYIGIRGLRESGPISITVFSQDDFEIARDARRLSLDEFSAKYPSVREARDRRLAHAAAGRETTRDQLPRDKEFGELEIELYVDRSQALGKLLHVGDDYILVAYDGDPETRRIERRYAYAIRSISQIGWNSADNYSFRVSAPYIDKADAPK